MRLLKFCLSLLLFLSFSFANDTEGSKNVLAFELKDIKGNVYHITNTEGGMEIKELKGKVVFIAFFGHRCPPCRMEMPGFIKYTQDEEYAKKSTILAVEVQGLKSERLKDFVNNMKINYPVIPGEGNYNFINYVGYRTQWNNTIPFMVVLDQNGTVVNFGNGIVSPEELKSIVDQLSITKDSNTTNETNTTNDINNTD
jgi:thiol-disulfide isomerase/thioredoxin